MVTKQRTDTDHCPLYQWCRCPRVGTVDYRVIARSTKRKQERSLEARLRWVRQFRLKERRLIDIALTEGISYIRVYQIIRRTEEEIKRICL